AEVSPAAPRLLWSRLINGQCAAAETLLMELSNGVLRILIRRHFDERESTRTSSFTIAHDIHGRDVSSLRKQRGEVVFVGVVGEIADVEFVTHSALCAS